MCHGSTKPADHLHHDRLVLERGGRRLGNGPHTDVYTLAKEYQTGSSRNPVGSSAWALRAVFREIMAANDRRQKPDYAAITRAIRDFQLIE